MSSASSREIITKLAQQTHTHTHYICWRGVLSEGVGGGGSSNIRCCAAAAEDNTPRRAAPMLLLLLSPSVFLLLSLSLTPCFSSSFLFLPSLSLFYSTSFCFSIICFSCSALRLCFNLNCCSFCAVCRLAHLPVATRVTKLMETNSATDWATVRE